MVQAIVGGNWGDEGKGKMTDLLAADADIVVRFQGGANAGHTIINDTGKFALHLLPSGVFRPGVTSVIGQGVALDLAKLFRELDELETAGVKPRLLVSDRAQIVMPYHIMQDELEEGRLGKAGFGSTKSGIAPFYADKYSKTGIQVCELYDADMLRERVFSAVGVKNRMFETMYPGAPRLDAAAILAELTEYAERLSPLVGDAAAFLSAAVKDNKKILLEGQLGALKDPDNGIYPFTTSSSPLAGFACVGAAGIPPYAIEDIVTVVKAYSSAVGAGAFVSEIFGDEAEQLRRRGGDKGEYGATTGRPRRMGWFDAVATRYGCMLQGTTQVALSLLDVLGYLDEIPVCTAYEIDGRLTDSFPATPLLNRAKPVYTRLEGWKCNISGLREYDALPEAARRYVEFVEERIGYPIKMISVGSARDAIIYR